MNKNLEHAFQGLVRDIDKGGVPQRRVVRQGDRCNDFATALRLTAFVPSESMHAFGLQSQVLLLVHAHAVQSTPDMLLWEAAFNLTPSQSRVAS